MMNIGKLLGGLSLLITTFLPALAQDEPKTPFKDRIFFGGDLGLQFGNLTYIDVSPLVGYKITDKLHAGIGPTYIYYKYKDAYLNANINLWWTCIWKILVMDNLFVHSEYEMLNLEVPQNSSPAVIMN